MARVGTETLMHYGTIEIVSIGSLLASLNAHIAADKGSQVERLGEANLLVDLVAHEVESNEVDDQDSWRLFDRELLLCIYLTFAFLAIILVSALQEFGFAELLKTLLKSVTLVDLLQNEKAYQ